MSIRTSQEETPIEPRIPAPVGPSIAVSKNGSGDSGEGGGKAGISTGRETQEEEEDGSWPPRNVASSAATAYAQVRDSGPPLQSPDFPRLHQGLRDAMIVVREPTATAKERIDTAYLVRAGTDAQRAYRRLPEEAEKKGSKFAPVQIKRGGRLWGQILFCLVLRRRRGDGVNDPEKGAIFDAPSDTDYELCAIKELDRAVVHRHMEDRKWGENPYNEMMASQFIGDNLNVLGCMEVLQDERKLYFITPYCDGGELFDTIPWEGGGMCESLARGHFRDMLQCLNYLQTKQICHRDLSPENIMIHKGRCIVIDLGMCIRVPHTPDGRRRLIAPLCQCGKRPYMSPEVFASSGPFDGYAVDLWSVGSILFAMLTGVLLYDIPHPVDPSFKYLIAEGRLSESPSDESMIDGEEECGE